LHGPSSAAELVPFPAAGGTGYLLEPFLKLFPESAQIDALEERTGARVKPLGTRPDELATQRREAWLRFAFALTLTRHRNHGEQLLAQEMGQEGQDRHGFALGEVEFEALNGLESEERD
jgi:hypothetical protein